MIFINWVEQQREAKERVSTQQSLRCPLLHMLSHNFALIEQHPNFSLALVQAGCNFDRSLWDTSCAKV